LNFIEKWIAKIYLNKIKEAINMKGWKTLAGGIGLILSGLGLVVQGITAGDLTKVQEGIVLISLGLGGIGIGHKIEKTTNGGVK